jgi:hypothetical protein
MGKVLMNEMDRSSLLESRKELLSEARASEYLSLIVAAATLAPPGVEVDTALRCRRRPERKQCNGLLRLQLQECPAKLIWWCPSCGDNGQIQNWKGIPFNRAYTRGANGANKDEFCEVLLTNKEYGLLSEIAILESGAENAVQNARMVESGMMLLGSIDSLDHLLGYIAFEANHELKVRRLQALNLLFDKISSVLEEIY